MESKPIGADGLDLAAGAHRQPKLISRIGPLSAVLFCAFAVPTEPAVAQAQPTSSSEGGWSSPAGSSTGYWLTGDWDGYRTKLLEHGFNPEAVEIVDFFGNPSGGVRQGAVLQGFTKVGLGIDLEKALGWTGTSLYASASGVYGHGISSENIRNILLATDIDAQRGVQVYKAWLQQELFGSRLSLRFGLEEPGDDFSRHRYTGLFVNSSLAFPALGADDIHAPNTGVAFANPGLRLRAKLKVTDELEVVAAVYRGDVLGDHRLSESNGLLGIGELCYVPRGGFVAGLPIIFKVGGWYQAGGFADFRFDNRGAPLVGASNDGVPLMRQGDYALYGLVDQTIWRAQSEGGREIGVFARAAVAPGDRNFISSYVDGGVVVTGPFEARANDRLGLAVAHAAVGSSIRGLDEEMRALHGSARPIRDGETAVELTYQVQLAPWWTLQPDFQYVLHPSGNVLDPTDTTHRRSIRNAAVLGLRTMLIF